MIVLPVPDVYNEDHIVDMDYFKLCSTLIQEEWVYLKG